MSHAVRQKLVVTYDESPQRDAVDVHANISFPNLQARPASAATDVRAVSRCIATCCSVLLAHSWGTRSREHTVCAGA